ncbi:MAG: hypothetical protein A2252_03215 [Elusimicrobia bacterium RIFOXYA2_FULL_39_19]|nr:MAG: hypothetical protein A2252_03215 [Elusimicrobia bacterium RIFOXYA2_FULL_39_19]
MKTLLVSPPTHMPIYNQSGRLKRVAPGIASGLLYLAAMLEKEKLPVSYLDMYDYSYEKIEETIKTMKPDIVGITCLTEIRIASLKVAEIIKKVDNNIIVVFGGTHPTFFPEQILNNYPNVDYLVMNEGEYTFLELVKALKDQKPLSEIQGIAFRKDKQVVITQERPPIDDLDALPFPSHHLLDWKLYIPAGFNPDEWLKSNKRYSTVVTSRGCPYKCSYCSSTVFWGSKYRYRSPKNVIDEVEMLHKEYNVEYFGFADDDFTPNMKRVVEICNEIKRRNLNIKWNCATRVNFVDRPMLEIMKETGCYNIFFGVESCSQTILKNIKKHASVEQMINAFNLCRDIGISATMALMVGNPGENEQTIKETIDMMKNINPESINVEILIVFPNTEIYEIAKRSNFINDDYWLSKKAAPLFTVEKPLSTLLSYQFKIKMHYYLNRNDYFQVMLLLMKRYKITNFILNILLLITNKIKKTAKIKSFGLYKILGGKYQFKQKK